MVKQSIAIKSLGHTFFLAVVPSGWTVNTICAAPQLIRNGCYECDETHRHPIRLSAIWPSTMNVIDAFSHADCEISPDLMMQTLGFFHLDSPVINIRPMAKNVAYGLVFPFFQWSSVPLDEFLRCKMDRLNFWLAHVVPFAFVWYRGCLAIHLRFDLYMDSFLLKGTEILIYF